MEPPFPENEAKRMEALRETGLLDTPPEYEFDSLARLASVICETPIALLTLIDEERQWYKSNLGLEAAGGPRAHSICAHAILEPEMFVVEDATRDPRFAENPSVTGDPNIRFYAGVPLDVGKGLRVGTLCVIDRSPRELSASQSEALQLLGQQATRHIKARREQYLLRQAIALNQLVESELRADRGLFHAFMDHSPFIALMKDASGKTVYYNQRCADRFQVDRLAGLGKYDEELWPAEVAAANRVADREVLGQWRTVITEEVWGMNGEGKPTEWRNYRFPFRDSDGREYVAGFLIDVTLDKEAERKIRQYQDAMEEVNTQLRRLAVTDGLTGLRNRRAFDSMLEQEYEVARRYSHPLSLLLIDIDHFKRFNDTFGHEEGDRVLRRVARAMEATFRGADLVARYGGEEFAVILPNTARLSAVESAERLRATIAGFAGEREPITISVGLASLQSLEWTTADLVKHADNSLYRAKREGRNRVCVG